MLRVPELLNQRGFASLFVAFFPESKLAECMAEHLGNGKALHTLGTPIRTDFVAGYAPHLGGVITEKCFIQLGAEAVNEEILQAILLTLMQHAEHVAEAHLHHAVKAEVADGVHAERYGIVKELTQEKNAAQARAHQHGAILILRIRAIFCQRNITLQLLVIAGGGTL